MRVGVGWLLLALFLLLEGLAVWARIADTPGAGKATLQGLALTVLLFAGMYGWWIVTTRHAHRHLRSLHENGHVAWIASLVPETRRVVSDLTRGLISHLPGTIVVALEASGLAIFDARNARPLMTIPYVVICSVEVGHARYFGTSNRCVSLDLRVGDSTQSLPIMLHSETAPHFWTQARADLESNAERIRSAMQLAR